MIVIPVSNGELVDKLTILKIKMSKMSNEPLVNVTNEYTMLLPFLEQIGMSVDDELFQKLYRINLEFWEYHDWQREQYIKCIDENLINIELYKKNRYEHIMNDNRAKVKKEINIATKSLLIEEKQFISYKI